ncbi:MAG: hypothetical protein PHU44_14865 [Syntrophales bacterium]|nr:hypothetical protein [Syntrophales bacterium]MDD5641825.1 hypothetical protein [Syntrophales bacterium]
MAEKCLVEKMENRDLDSYDLITVLGLLKEHDGKEIYRRYSPDSGGPGKINLLLSTESYYVEMTVEILTSLALSPKYQASPNLMQALIRRLLCGHRHNLILEKIRSYGVPVEDPTQLNLSCSVGTMGADLVANHHLNAPEYRFRKFGTSRVEQEEQRPLDHFDAVSILYLAQQNQTERILNRYVPQELLNEGTEGEQVVRFSSPAGDYQVDFFFQKIHNDVPRGVPERGNVSSATMHQVLRRLFAGHAPELVAKELTDKGILITPAEVDREFSLARILNDNYLEMGFRR